MRILAGDGRDCAVGIDIYGVEESKNTVLPETSETKKTEKDAPRAKPVWESLEVC